MCGYVFERICVVFANAYSGICLNLYVGGYIIVDGVDRREYACGFERMRTCRMIEGENDFTLIYI